MARRAATFAAGPIQARIETAPRLVFCAAEAQQRTLLFRADLA